MDKATVHRVFRRRLGLLAGVVAVTVAMHAEPCAEHPQTLAAAMDCYRPLLVFAPSVEDASFKQQLAELKDKSRGLVERNVLVVRLVAGEETTQGQWTGDVPSMVWPAQEQRDVRKRFHLVEGSFAVILIGKDGGEKLRKKTAISFSELVKTIDAMPMRQSEMRQTRE